MEENTLMLTIDGDIQLEDLSRGLARLSRLADDLVREIRPEGQVSWAVVDLGVGSASVTLRGVSTDVTAVPAVLMAFDRVGLSLQAGEPIPYSPAVRKSAAELASLVDGHVRTIYLETPTREVAIGSPHEGQPKPHATYSLGMVKGTVETLSGRHGRRFVIYDNLFDEPIQCQYGPDDEAILRSAYRGRVAVTGRIKRSAETGRAFSVSDITSIEILPEGSDMRRAMGILPEKPGAEPSEVVIRRLRDGQA